MIRRAPPVIVYDHGQFHVKLGRKFDSQPTDEEVRVAQEFKFLNLSRARTSKKQKLPYKFRKSIIIGRPPSYYVKRVCTEGRGYGLIAKRNLAKGELLPIYYLATHSAVVKYRSGSDALSRQYPDCAGFIVDAADLGYSGPYYQGLINGTSHSASNCKIVSGCNWNKPLEITKWIPEGHELLACYGNAEERKIERRTRPPARRSMRLKKKKSCQ